MDSWSKHLVNRKLTISKEAACFGTQKCLQCRQVIVHYCSSPLRIVFFYAVIVYRPELTAHAHYYARPVMMSLLVSSSLRMLHVVSCRYVVLICFFFTAHAHGVEAVMSSLFVSSSLRMLTAVHTVLWWYSFRRLRSCGGGGFSCPCATLADYLHKLPLRHTLLSAFSCLLDKELGIEEDEWAEYLL